MYCWSDKNRIKGKKTTTGHCASFSHMQLIQVLLCLGLKRDWSTLNKLTLHHYCVFIRVSVNKDMRKIIIVTKIRCTCASR